MAHKKHKQAFIAEHGQEKWDLKHNYMNRGDRSPEATEAVKIYQRFAYGLNQDTWTVYGILENGVLKYVGSTGKDWRHRWSNHKSAARTLKNASALHYAMNSISTNHKLFAEYTFTILHQYNDEQTAKDMEIALIKAHNTHITGYNVLIGGGNNSKKFKTRPLSTPDDLQTR
jgi:hypothetical protein